MLNVHRCYIYSRPTHTRRAPYVRRNSKRNFLNLASDFFTFWAHSLIGCPSIFLPKPDFLVLSLKKQISAFKNGRNQKRQPIRKNNLFHFFQLCESFFFIFCRLLHLFQYFCIVLVILKILKNI